MTAPSMQPPETEPTIAPSLSTTSREPTGRGELPQVFTTVAMATLRPSLSQVPAVDRTSSWVAKAVFSVILNLLARRRDARLRPAAAPRTRRPTPPAHGAQPRPRVRRTPPALTAQAS